jgi:hypothetical protein
MLIAVGFRHSTTVVEKAVVVGAESRTTEVVVARAMIEAGESLDMAKLVLERRPQTTLPPDVITSFEVIRNKVAAGPIPRGYPLALALLADPVVTLPVDPAAVNGASTNDPIDQLLAEIEKSTVAVPVTFLSSAPNRGARIAVALSPDRGRSVLVSEECWVASSSGRDAVLRVNPDIALVLQAAKAYGLFNFIEIPAEGPSPYAGKGITSESDLKVALSDLPVTPTPLSKPTERRHLKGYAWVPGSNRKFTVDDQGTIVMMGNESRAPGRFDRR